MGLSLTDQVNPYKQESHFGRPHNMLLFASLSMAEVNENRGGAGQNKLGITYLCLTRIEREKYLMRQ